jgi:hypothetical protein
MFRAQALQIYRLGRLVLMAESKNIGTPLRCMTELGVSLMGSKVLKKTRERAQCALLFAPAALREQQYS